MSIRSVLLSAFLVVTAPLVGSPNAFAQHADAPTPRYYGLLSAGAGTTVGNEEASFGLGPAATAVTVGASARLHRAFALDLTQTGSFGTETTRFTTRLGGRLIWAKRLASPYLLAGVSGTAANGFNIGATLGLGLDWTASPRFDLFQQVTFDLPFSSNAFGESTRGVGFVGGGLRMRIAPFVRPVNSVMVVAPDTARIREAVSLQAVADAAAARPIEYVWSFDDGYTATGEIVTREFRYARPYSATVVATNRDGSFSETKTVEVHPMPAPKTEAEPVITGGSAARDVEILELYGQRSLMVGEPETYRLRLARRVTNQTYYEWEFGDGVASIRNSVTHSYDAPGTYSLRAIARTEAGADTLYATITVTDPDAPSRPRTAAVPRIPTLATATASTPTPASLPATRTVAATTVEAAQAAAPSLPRRAAPDPAPSRMPPTPTPTATLPVQTTPPQPDPRTPDPEPVATPAPRTPASSASAAPAPAPSVMAAPSPAGPFGWMVAAFRDKSRADALASSARNAMMAARVVTDATPQGPAVYRVIVGEYATEADAKNERYKAQALTRGPVRLTPLNSELSP